MRDTGRVKPLEIASKVAEIKEPVKIGDRFGPSWTTHWFLINITLP